MFGLADEQPPQIENLPVTTKWTTGYPYIGIDSQNIFGNGTYTLNKAGITVTNPGTLWAIPDKGGEVYYKLAQVKDNKFGTAQVSKVPNGKYWVYGQFLFKLNNVEYGAVYEPADLTIQGFNDPPAPGLTLAWGANMPAVGKNEITGEGTYKVNIQGYTINGIRLIALPEKGGIPGFKDVQTIQNGTWSKTVISNVPAGNYKIFAIATAMKGGQLHYFVTEFKSKPVLDDEEIGL